jgi:hypothetical protein
VTLDADTDASIDQGDPTTNFGTDESLQVQSDSADASRVLAGFSLPAPTPGCVVQSATLRLYSSSATGDRTLEVHQVAAEWTEAAVTWDNQPATTGDPATTDSWFGTRRKTASPCCSSSTAARRSRISPSWSSRSRPSHQAVSAAPSSAWADVARIRLGSSPPS